MTWPPQNTGLFEPPSCIQCFVPPPPCQNLYNDNPFDDAHFTMTKASWENAGIVMTSTNMGTFRRLSFDIPAGAFGISRHFIFTDLTYDPQQELCPGAPSTIGYSMRARLVSATIAGPSFSFFPIVTQNGNFYYAGFSVRHWNYSSVSAVFSNKGALCNWNGGDAWDRITVEGGGPSGSPDFSDTASPIKHGFRVIGLQNFEGVTRNATLDVEFFGGSFNG